MRLYATTTSERATKGQGGNDYIAIKITYKEDKETKTFANLYFHQDKDGNFELINEDTDELIYFKKGKKKKDNIRLHNCLQHAKCEVCNSKV